MCFKFNSGFLFLFLLLLNKQFELSYCGFYATILRLVSLFDLNVFIFVFFITFFLIFFCKKQMNTQLYFFYCIVLFLFFFLLKKISKNFTFYFLPEKKYFTNLVTFLNVFEGPSYLHGISFLFFFSLTFTIVNLVITYKSIVHNNSVLSRKFVFFFQFLSFFVFISGAYWAFFSSVWGNWYNNDSVELFYIIFFFFIAYFTHSFRNHLSTFYFLFILLAVVFLCFLRFGFFNSKHAGSTHTFKSNLFGFWFLCFIFFLFFFLFNNLTSGKFKFFFTELQLINVLHQKQQLNKTFFLFFILLSFIFFLFIMLVLNFFAKNKFFLLQFYFFLLLFFFSVFVFFIFNLFMQQYFLICFIFYHFFFILFVLGWFLYSWSFFIFQNVKQLDAITVAQPQLYNFYSYRQLELNLQNASQTTITQINFYKRLVLDAGLPTNKIYQYSTGNDFKLRSLLLPFSFDHTYLTEFNSFFNVKYYSLFLTANYKTNFFFYLLKPLNVGINIYSCFLQFDCIFISSSFFFFLLIIFFFL